MSGEFADRVVLVTGGTRGIGLAIARRFLDEGALVAICSKGEASVRAATDLLADDGERLLAMACDVSDSGDVDRLFDLVVSRWGRLDVAVCAAGVCPWDHLEAITPESVDQTMAINVKGPLVVARRAAALMTAARRGAIVNIGSIGGIAADPEGGLAVYCASKAAVHLLTMQIAAELAPYGVRVNAIAPGWIATDINAEIRADAALLSKYTKAIPLGRFGRPEEIASVAAFLASDAAAFVTGAVVPVDGGNLAI
jgi:NAD(P)-dependent dehydrogenase (short-subunit alcohol dehydrogenase family)